MLANDLTGGKKRVEVILQAKDADNPVLRALLKAENVRLSDRIGDSDTLVVNLPLAAIENLSTSGTINYMSPDRQVGGFGHIENATGVNLIRNQAADGTTPAYRLDGSGVGIAVLDSGMYTAHNGFKDDNGVSRIVYSQNFINSNAASFGDGYGHGTHVAGIAAGDAARNNGSYRGIARNADIINLRVLNGAGRGQTSWLLNALDWILQNHQTYNIRVVNLSLGTPAVDSYTNDPICVKVAELVKRNIVVVAAAGNHGKKSNGDKVYGHIHSPGNSPYVITVGASNTKGTYRRGNDLMATYSSHGPTRSYYQSQR